MNAKHTAAIAECGEVVHQQTSSWSRTASKRRLDVVHLGEQAAVGARQQLVDGEHADAATGASSSRRASDRFEQGDCADAEPLVRSGARPGSFVPCELAEHAAQRASARACARASLVSSRRATGYRDVETVADPVVGLGAGAAALEPGARMQRCDCHAARTVGRRRVNAASSLAGRALKVASRFARIDQAVARSRLGQHVARAATDPARSSPADARRRRAGSAPRPGRRAPTPRAAACGASAACRGSGRARAAGRTRAGVSFTRSPSRVTSRSGTSIRSSPTSITGPASGAAAPQHRAQAREQLVDAERLRHVVVRAGVERGDLLALLADRREHDHRRVASTCAARGRRRCRCRRAARGRGSPPPADARRRPRAPPRRSSAVSTSKPAPRSVVPSARRICGSSSTTRTRWLHAGSSAGTSTTGSASANVAPCPGRDSAQTRPPFAAANPRAIASPRPAPERWSPPLR